MIRFLLSMFAFWGFNTLGWIVLNEGGTGFWGYFWLVFWVGLIVALVEVVLFGFKFFVQIFSIPLSCLTGGLFANAMNGVFIYIGLLVAASWTEKFSMPWILGDYWWQALLIGFAFALIRLITASRSSSK